VHVVAAYDVRDGKVRERLRRLLWRYGLSPISKSVYAGRLSWDKARRLASQASEILEPTDSLVIIPLQDNEFRRAVIVTKDYVSKRMPGDVIVIDGDAELCRGSSEDTRRANSV